MRFAHKLPSVVANWQLTPIVRLAATANSNSVWHRNFVTHQLLVGILALLLALILSEQIDAAPKINGLNLHALQVGQTTRIVFNGTELLADSVVVSSLAIGSQQVIEANGGQITLDIQPDTNAAPGIYAIRLKNAQGISNPFLIAVDQLPNLPHAETVSQMPVAFYGELRGAQLLKTQFDAKAGQMVIVEIDGNRLGSMIRPIIRIYNSRGAQVQWSRPMDELSGDTRCQAQIPADGKYTVELHDVLFRSPAQAYFRMKIGTFNFVDLPFPLAVEKNKLTTITFPGSSFGESFKLDFQSVQTGWQPIPIQEKEWFTGHMPAVLVSDFRQYVEQDSPENVAGAVPLGINGQLVKPGEVDRFVLEVKPKQKLRFDMLASRIGSPVDGKLVLQSATGGQLATNDDRPNMADPGFDYTVADGIEKVILLVSDVTAKGGIGHVYHVNVSDLSIPNFSLTLSTDAVNIPLNGTAIINVDAQRNGYNGPIQLDLPGLPETATVSGNVIQPGSTKAILTITSGTEPINKHEVVVAGRPADQQAGNTVFASWPASTVSKQLPWQQQRLAVASATGSPIAITLQDQPVNELLLGGQVKQTISVTRAAETSGDIRLRLVTSQTVPKKTIKEDNKDKVVDDVERTLRLANEVIIDGAQSSADVIIAVPNDLPEQTWALVLIAELLSADKKSVVATSVLPTRFVPARRALTIKVTGERKIEVDPANKKPGTIVGEIARTGQPQAVTVTLVGLPKEVPAPSVVVPAESNMFQLNLEVPENIKPELLNNVSVLAKLMDGDLVKASSNKIKISIAIAAKTSEAKPAADQKK